MRNIEMDHNQIEAKLPHRSRALLLDKAEIIQEDNGLIRAIGYRIVTLEDCEGHFPDYPIMRGVDRVEMIALTLGLATMSRLEEGYLAYLVGLDAIRFPEIVRPGDEIRSEATISRQTRRLIEGSGKAFVGNKLVAEVGKISCVIGKKP